MSFSHFRLGQLAFSNALPPHLMHANGEGGTRNDPNQEESSQFVSQTDTNPQNSSAKAPYGSGLDFDDGYTLVFPNIQAFNEWRAQEEETQVVEFVKGDTHGSKAVPPRFKEHTKLVCARHSRSGRKKYIKKHPERQRKVPSRKIEGGGCPASISFKTYFDTDEVRACYMSEHSHEIGLANLPFTRRGRKSMAALEKEKTKKPSVENSPVTPANGTQQTYTSVLNPLPTPFPQSSAPIFNQSQVQFGVTHPFPLPQGLDRWENMSILFNSLREHARSFEYPMASIAALETILVRLYLETPVQGYTGQPPTMPPFVQPPPPRPSPPRSEEPIDSNHEKGPSEGDEAEA